MKSLTNVGFKRRSIHRNVLFLRRCYSTLSVGAPTHIRNGEMEKMKVLIYTRFPFFIKQIAFVAMETGISEEIINQVVPAAIGKSWELASELLFDPMVGMKLAIELFDSGNKSLMIYGINERNLFIQTMARLIV